MREQDCASGTPTLTWSPPDRRRWPNNLEYRFKQRSNRLQSVSDKSSEDVPLRLRELTCSRVSDTRENRQGCHSDREAICETPFRFDFVRSRRYESHWSFCSSSRNRSSLKTVPIANGLRKNVPRTALGWRNIESIQHVSKHRTDCEHTRALIFSNRNSRELNKEAGFASSSVIQKNSAACVLLPR